MALSPRDRLLLRRCLNHEAGAWEDFVDRFLGLVIHVIAHTAKARSLHLSDADREDLASEVFVALIHDNYRALRNFRGGSSLATYLTVIARRVVVRELLKRKSAPARLTEVGDLDSSLEEDRPVRVEDRIGDRELIERMLRDLHGPEADVIRMYHLEGKSYREISSQVGMPENSVGPTLSRARAKMRQAANVSR